MEMTKEQRTEFLLNVKPKQGFKYTHICNFDKEAIAIANYIENYKSEWLEDTFLRDTYPVFKEGYNYHICDVMNPGQNEEPYIIGWNNKDEKLIELCKPILDELETIFDGRHSMTWLALLPVGCKVPLHTDHLETKVFTGDNYLKLVHRIHIPITTNPGVFFKILGEKKHMKVGECWDINQNVLHEIWNEGETDRVHLIVDMLPYKWL